MRRLALHVGCALLAVPASARATGPDTGGSAAPPSASRSEPRPVPAAAPPARPIATEFTVAPAALPAGATVSFTYRIDGPGRRARVRIVFVRSGAAARRTLRLGYQPTGRRRTFAWTPEAGELPSGDYAVALQAFDDRGRALRRSASAAGQGRLTIRVAPAPEATAPGVFPVAGPFSFGGEDARFGAGRPGHVHQGQDVIAASGTPLVAPVAGTVSWIRHQPRGAGHYVVLRGADGRDYVFMHLKAGSISVAEGAPLAAGQPFAQVGSTGAATGAHLHFELWPDGWYAARASAPIDPLPQLLAWAAAR